MPLLAPPETPGADTLSPKDATDNAASPDTESPGSTRPRRRLGIVVVGLCAIGAAAAAWIILSNGDSTTAASELPATITAVVAEQRDLIEYTDLDGTMGYATTLAISASAAGVITDVVDDGATLVRGDQAVEVDAQPVVVMYGDQPFHRTMTEGIEGHDVRILEENLASLGFHATEDDDGDEVDAGFSVDGVYDSATTAAVKRWQDELGIIETGVVTAGAAVVVSGPAIAADPVELAARVQQGAPLLSLNIVGSEANLYSEHAGEIELVAAGGRVEDGAVLYVVDDIPVAAILVSSDADVEFDRDLFDGVVDGDDVREVEEMLVALGYDARGDLDVDDVFDEYTAEAIADWKEDLQDDWSSVTVDSTLRPADVIAVDPEAVIERSSFDGQDYRAKGAELYSTGSTAVSRIVTTSIEVADQGGVTEGMEVAVEFPDEQTVTGIVTDVATTSTRDLTDPDAKAELAVEVMLPLIPQNVERFSELDVEVKLVDRIAEGATVVPASALVATNDGYAVETVVDDTTQYVAVEPGMFADGFVEVAGIDPGTAVVVPR